MAGAAEAEAKEVATEGTAAEARAAKAATATVVRTADPAVLQGAVVAAILAAIQKQ